MSWLLLLSSILAPALAGDGPWTLAPGDQSVYLGVGTFRYKALNGETPGDGVLGQGITSVGAIGVYSRGLTQGSEVEVLLPLDRVRVNTPSDALCRGGSKPADF